MTGNRWWDYVSAITPNASGKQIAEWSGIDAASVSRWKTGQSGVSADAAVRLARAAGRPPIEALVVAGFLEPDEVEQLVPNPIPIRDLTDDDLLDEVRRRMSAQSSERQVVKTDPE